MTTDWFDAVKTELLAQNPFRGSEYFRRFSSGALAREQAWGHISQWYFLICWFPRMFSGIHSRCDQLEVRKDCARHLLVEDLGWDVLARRPPLQGGPGVAGRRPEVLEPVPERGEEVEPGVEEVDPGPSADPRPTRFSETGCSMRTGSRTRAHPTVKTLRRRSCSMTATVRC